MGNSKTILKRAYQELTTEAEAKEWFATDPDYIAKYDPEAILAFIKGKAVGEKLARKAKKAKEAVEEEGYDDDPSDFLTEEEMREAVGRIDVTTEDTLPAYLNPKKAKLFKMRKAKK
jgi:hypothetical protein